MASYVERSALQIMSNMDRRKAAVNKYRFYSMIGSVSVNPCERIPREGVKELAGLFMEICEKKGDYSFIFTSSPRLVEEGRRWRPQLDHLPSIISWHCSGESQPSHRDPTSQVIWLEKVLVLDHRPQLSPSDFSTLSGKARHFILTCVRTLGDESTPDTKEDITGAMLKILKIMGYSGSDEYICTDIGLFYPQTPLSAPHFLSPSHSNLQAIVSSNLQSPRIQMRAKITLLVSTELRWTFGAPGLAKLEAINDDDVDGADISSGEMKSVTFVPGVFAGIIDPADPRAGDYPIGY